jgi:fatty acid desaturase
MPPSRRAVTPARRIEGRTLALIGLVYGLWALATTGLAEVSVPLAVLVLIPVLALHASLTHEVIHGHPTPWQGLNAALMRPALGLVVPYGRFRDTHLAHHRDEALTDPYDDPESNFLDPAVWARLSAPVRGVLRLNNTLLGRLVLGPLVGTAMFLRWDLRALAAGDRGVALSWAAHGLALVPVLAWLGWAGALPVWAYGLAVYLSMSVLKIRTFLEHRAHEKARARTVVIEDRGPLAFLFLNNNFHVVHHMHPGVPWYELPRLFAARRTHYLRRNDGYRYAGYGEVLRRYFTVAKDPVPHPLMVPAESPSPATLPTKPLMDA